MKKFITFCFTVLVCFTFQLFAQIPTNILVQISKAEDELRFDKTLENLMNSGNAKIRHRAALASGRIGRETAIPILAKLLESDSDISVRATAAFALGEIESIIGADAILKVLQNTKNADEIRARAVEAAGKIAAANAKDAKAKNLGEAILDALQFEDNRGAKQNRAVVLLGITAVLRGKPGAGDFTTAKFLTNKDARIRADAANTLSRLRSKIANEKLRAMLLSDNDPIARANAARALGAAGDKDAFNLLLESAVSDEDSRVRVSAIRSLGSLKDAKVADRLLTRGEKLLTEYKQSKFAAPIEKNELLEIATTLGRILTNMNNERAIKFTKEFREIDKISSPETEIAFVRISPNNYLEIPLDKNNSEWQSFSSIAQGFAETANLDSQFGQQKEKAIQQLKDVFINYPQLHTDDGIGRATPDILRAYAQFKTPDLSDVLRDQLNSKIPTFRNVNERIFIRATIAELLGEQPANKENVEALKTAFAESLKTDKQYNDAQLAILSALVKLDKKEAIDSLKLALDAPNFLVRRHAAQLIKQNDLQTSFPNVDEKVGTVKPYNRKTGTKLGQVLNTNADYLRAVSRKSAKAILTTEKGTFTIEFFPEDAPLTVDNFIKLARRNYFNGLAIHRVVPNFVMQDGDPRGDGNGGPGWEIRDEINMVEYERGAVGMALSGKDTGGSQWFVTHSPQPHLDGGYTVFGRVNQTDMKIIDNLARGDKILSVKIVEGNSPQKNAKARNK
ncbi:MAG TPA: peptidylprolyl isomerase [Pyrinomonadaceae bacterium]|nr:peptidylprolyl isomerase [Pyrinomonadaceae bacterium]